MKIRTRIFLCFLVLVAAGFAYLVHWITEEIRPRYLEAVEESLVDTAHILAAVVSERVDDKGRIHTGFLRSVFGGVSARTVDARIYELVKTNVDLRVYVTDPDGTVLFDSDGGRDEGRDYSRWNDVLRTLRGEYGARATRADPGDINSLVLYVAAPVTRNGRILGALTVCKPIVSANQFIAAAQRKIVVAGALSALVVALLGLLTSVWVTKPIQQLTRYAARVRDGERPSLPRLGASEIGLMGQTLEEMRHALEGKEYVERYVQTLTHELKGPLSAVRGAVELLDEDVPAAQRRRFLKNIRTESDRIRRIVDRLLLLASVESRQGLRDVEDMDLAAVARDVVESMRVALEEKGLKLDLRLPSGIRIRGERFLVRHAVMNLLQNAVDFSPAGGSVAVSLEADEGGTVSLWVQDDGPGIPDYALGRVYDRFYSLQRPDTGQKSSGLGLNFVREVAELHGGSITLENRPGGGASARLSWPRCAG